MTGNDSELVSEMMLRIRRELKDNETKSPLGELPQPTSPSSFSATTFSQAVGDVRMPDPFAPRVTPLSVSEPHATNVESNFQAIQNKLYRLRDLTRFDDRQFITVAYRAILQRLPDDGGLQTYLRLLRSGTAKEEILDILRSSPEGTLVGVSIQGLRVRTLCLQVSRLPVVGWLVRFLGAAWRLPRMEEARRAERGRTNDSIDKAIELFIRSSSSTNQAIRDLEKASAQTIAFAATKLSRGDLAELESSIDKVKESLGDLNVMYGSLARIEDMNAIRSSMTHSTHVIDEKLADLARTKADQSTVASVLADSADMKVALRELDQSLRIEIQNATKSPEPDHVLDGLYATFEDRFRGTRAEIRLRQGRYLPYIRRAGAGAIDKPILDLGCGRGEWLEILREEGMSAQGVDLNRIFLELCRKMELPVVEQDALTYLRSLATASVGAITSFHLIEHLQPTTLVAVLDECLRVLTPGGVLILETPNPENLVVGACNFYYDYSHVHPLPPESTRFLLEARGYANVITQDLHSNPDFEYLNDVLKEFGRYFTTGQDYAVFGWKH